MEVEMTTTLPEAPPAEPGLKPGLKNRHLSMIAIGGVIGAGLFVGSGSGIAAAGPGILVSLALFGLLPGSDHPASGFSNLTAHGGFLPHGPGAILTGVLMVVFSFMGSEIVTLAAGESQDPQAAVTKATNSVIWRIAVFYLGS